MTCFLFDEMASGSRTRNFQRDILYEEMDELVEVFTERATNIRAS